MKLLVVVASYSCRTVHERTVRGLSANYPKLTHATFSVHALHRICETIRELCPNVDKLVADGKKTFVKSLARSDLVRNKGPDTQFP
jgi:hypothetical protein